MRPPAPGWNDRSEQSAGEGANVVTVTPPASGASSASSPGPANGAGRHAADGEPSLGELVKAASESVSTIVRGEIELAKLELTSTFKNAGTGIGLFAAAAVLLVFSLTFGLIALAEGLCTLGIWRWASFLIVFGFLLVLIALCVLLGIRKVKRVHAPQRTIETGKDTVAYLKANAKRS
jgi:uncharacterized membrane protein YqjE